MHDPIYPAAGQDVTYTLERVSGSTLARVELYETVFTLDASAGVVREGKESSLFSWTSPQRLVRFTRAGGYAGGSFVRYRFVVRARSGLWPHTESYEQVVSFATRPNPVRGVGRFQPSINPMNVMPAPVYVVGDPDAAFDIVLIPDTDIRDSEMETFRDHCRRMIREAFLDEPTIRLFRRSFNFYINPLAGHATDYSSFVADQVRGAHKPPANYGALDFAEGRVLMHKGELQDYALIKIGLFSTEMQDRGTMLHECGHALFGLADEYPGGVPWEAEPYPNVWDAGSDAAAEALSRGKWPWDVRVIDGTNPRWWKLCIRSCQMSKAGEKHTIYDWPCHGRVEWCVLDNALH